MLGARGSAASEPAVSVTIPIDARALKLLRDHAITAGTLEQWSNLACEWAEKAEAYVSNQAARIHILESDLRLACTADKSDAAP